MTFKSFPNIIIKDDNFEHDIKILFQQIRPNWDLNSLKIKRFCGGVSNFLYGVYVDETFTDTTDMVLVRIYGEMLLDRSIEMENMTALSNFDLAARTWGKFVNGCAYQYIHGTVLELENLHEEFYLSLIINELARLHTTDIYVKRKKEPFLFVKLKEMANHLPETLLGGEKNQRYLSQFPSKLAVFKEISFLESLLVKPEHPVSFCHNDLLVHNIILNAKRDRIHFIDFEYADFNYSAYDIANLFNEFAGLENVDYSKFPDETFQKSWIKRYLMARLNMSNSNKFINEKDRIIKENDVEYWYNMVIKFSLASHLFWGIWSIWQVQNSKIQFDFLSYAIIRWNRYVMKKSEFLEL